MPRRRWVWRNGQKTEVTADYRPAPRHHNVIGDIQPYRSMATGEIIGGRRQHRDHLKAHGLVEVGTEKIEGRKPFEPDSQSIVNDIKRAARETGHDWL